MSCPSKSKSGNARLLAFVAGRLTNVEANQVASHLQSCVPVRNSSAPRKRSGISSMDGVRISLPPRRSALISIKNCIKELRRLRPKQFGSALPTQPVDGSPVRRYPLLW